MHWLRRERELFPLLQLPRQARSLVYKHALSSHAGVRIVDGEVKSTPHPLLLTSQQVNQEVRKVKDDCALNISCKLTALGQAKKSLARYDRLYPRQRQRLRICVFPSGLSWTHAEHYDVWAAAWEAAFDTPAFQGIDIDFLPRFSLRAIWEWDAWGYLYTFLALLGTLFRIVSKVLDMLFSALDVFFSALKPFFNALDDLAKSGALDMAVEALKVTNNVVSSSNGVSQSSGAKRVKSSAQDAGPTRLRGSDPVERARERVDAPVRMSTVTASTKRR